MPRGRRGLSEVLGAAIVLAVILSGVIVYARLADYLGARGEALIDYIEKGAVYATASRAPGGVVVSNPSGKYIAVTGLIVNTTNSTVVIDVNNTLVAPGSSLFIEDPPDGEIVGVIVNDYTLILAPTTPAASWQPNTTSNTTVIDYNIEWFLDGLGAAYAPYALSGLRPCNLTPTPATDTISVSLDYIIFGGTASIVVIASIGPYTLSEALECPITEEPPGAAPSQCMASLNAPTATLTITLDPDPGRVWVNVSASYTSPLYYQPSYEAVLALAGGQASIGRARVTYGSATAEVLGYTIAYTEGPAALLYGDERLPVYELPVASEAFLSAVFTYTGVEFSGSIYMQRTVQLLRLYLSDTCDASGLASNNYR